jgi:hypothetical protein
MNATENELERIERLADLLDSSFSIPGTDIRFGLDSIAGLVPGLGDATGLFASLYIMTRLERLGLSRWTRARMAANVGLDALVGVVPLLGDIFDLAFKANRRNIALARAALERSGKVPMTIDLEASAGPVRPDRRLP